jgi:ubiquinone/menaquinone biosynthesis C-methylase UbiE
MVKEKDNRNQENTVRMMFNDMADEYDHLSDLWYQYTFSSIDKVISTELRPPLKAMTKPLALDVGCGTGIQSLRLASLGYRVIGVDIAEKLVTKAQDKLFKHDYPDTQFYIADAQYLPFQDGIASCVNCCGPTLSFIPNWRNALLEISRCLRPNGKLLLEVEGKWNIDLFWEIANSLFRNFLGYNETFSVALSHLLPPWKRGHTIAYSFRLESGNSVSMPLKLFTSGELEDELNKAGLTKIKQWGLHVVTNVIPSTILHEPKPHRSTRKAFRILASMEKNFNTFSPINKWGCSLLILAQKNQQNGE